MNCDGVSNLLSAYLDGELSPGELLRVEEHLRRCHACADEVDSLRQTMALVASLEEVEVPASFQFQLHQRLVALGPPAAAVRRTPAAPAWQRNARHWAVPAAAAAAALAIGLTTYGGGSNLPPIPGLQSQSVYTVPQPATPIATNNPTQSVDPGTAPVQESHDVTSTQPIKATDISPKPDVTVPVITPGPLATDGTKAATPPPEKAEPVKTDKQMVYAYNVTVPGPLDPKMEERVTGENTLVEKGNNTLTLVVPVGSREAMLDKVLKAYWPGSTVVDASHDTAAEIAGAQLRLETARRQLEDDRKDNQEQAVANDQKAVAEAQAYLDLLKLETSRATIVVTFTPAP
ncbi:MAG TPA: zf-HC2 domain-containing protein [Symbiobacteriaceae bacterium]|nr:zf-HC2 domain-containing protein [Symbiobacteriaceae bacterium]